MTLRDEAIQYAEEGRRSHQTWAVYLEHCETCIECRETMPSQQSIERAIGTLAVQRELVRKYDVILAVLKEGACNDEIS